MKTTKITIGCDHAAYELKQKVIAHLKERGVDVIDGIFTHQAPRIPRSCHGTGDLFAAVFTGALLRDKDLYESAVLAADFVRKCVENTPESTPHGVEFEEILPWLWEQL